MHQVTSTALPNETPHHRYKLNSECPHQSMGIEGVSLTKQWRPFPHKIDKLDKYFRTKTNPTGIIDYECFVPRTNEVVRSSLESFTKALHLYSLEELQKLDRADLIKVAIDLELDPTSKKNEFLQKLIIEAQNRWLEERPTAFKDSERLTSAARVPSMAELQQAELRKKAQGRKTAKSPMTQEDERFKKAAPAPQAPSVIGNVEDESDESSEDQTED